MPPAGRRPGDLYFSAYDTPAVIVYAERALPGREAPQDWDDLLDPKWKGKILIRDPIASGTMRAVWGMIIERSIETDRRHRRRASPGCGGSTRRRRSTC